MTLYVAEPRPLGSQLTIWPHDRRRAALASRGIVFDTDSGYAGVLLDRENRLLEATLPADDPGDAAETLGLGESSPFAGPDPALDLVDRIRRYFAGERIEFDWPLDLSTFTTFQREALSICASIPYGETRSYGWIAERMGRHKSARPVGQAMGRNPIPIVIPCHRVIGSNDRLIGYGGGTDWKLRLLRLEGVDTDRLR